MVLGIPPYPGMAFCSILAIVHLSESPGLYLKSSLWKAQKDPLLPSREQFLPLSSPNLQMCDLT